MKILFLSPWFPTPPVNGSKIRIYNLLSALTKLHDVLLISFTRPGEVVDLVAADSVCQKVITVPFHEFRPHGWRARMGYFSNKPRSIVDTYSIDMMKMVRENAPWADAVISSQIVTAPYAANVHVPIKIFEEIELTSGWDAWVRSIGLQRYRRYLTWMKTRGYMRTLLPEFRMATVVSSLEKAMVEKAVPGYQRVKVLPNGVDVIYYVPGLSPPVSGKLVYSGALTYGANYDAVRYFLAEILPLIRQHSPDVTLEITGSTQDVNLAGLQLDEYTRLTGFLDDIRLVVASAWVCIVPLRQGGGTRLKILESMALGTPVVSTSKGAEGLQVTPEENILIADDPESFARQVVRLLGDTPLRSRLAENGRHLVEQKYSWSEIGKNFCQLVESSAAS